MDGSAHVFCEVNLPATLSTIYGSLTFRGVREPGSHEKRAKHALFVGKIETSPLGLPVHLSANSVTVNPNTVQRFTVDSVSLEPPPQPKGGEPAPQSRRTITYNAISMELQGLYTN